MRTQSKVCPKCSQELTLEEFVKNKSTINGYGTYCRPCHNKIGVKNRTGKNAGYHRKLRYGITQSEYESLVRDTNGFCPICGNEPVLWHVDHNHATGTVRGVLCFNCNTGLGNFRDNPQALLMAAEYLKLKGGE